MKPHGRAPRLGAASARLSRSIALAAALVATGITRGQCPHAKLLAPFWNDAPVYSGVPVAIQGEVAIIGAPSDSVSGFVSGSARIYRFDGWAWVHESRLVASDGEEQTLFGTSVAISGDTAIVGAPSDDNENGGNAGSAYVYRFNEDTSAWVEESKLLASDGGYADHFGATVAISDDVALIGASGDGNECGPTHPCPSGSAYVFRFDPHTSQWQEEAKLVASDAADGDRFGGSVSIQGALAVIGAAATDDTGTDSGSAYVFHFDVYTSSWLEKAKLLPFDGAAMNRFGASVAISDDAIIAGAWGDDDNGAASGSAYIFRFDPAAQTWTEEAKLLASDGAYGDWFGASVDISGDRVIVGAGRRDDNGTNSGAAYLYCFDGSIWNEETKLTAVENAPNYEFGTHVAVDASLAVVGARTLDAECSVAGEAYVYDLPALAGSDCNNNGICDAAEIIDGTTEDCNENNRPDKCDIAGEWSQDINTNGVPDECDADCNGNGIPDDFDIAVGESRDCNGNEVPDECELTYRLDDGSGEGVVGNSDGVFDRVWLNNLAVNQGEETIVAISVAWRRCYVPRGAPLTLLVYDDPDNDGDPADAELLTSAATVVGTAETDEFVMEPVDATFVGNPGDSFFIGAHFTHYGFFMAIDTDSPYQSASWIVTAPAGEADLDNLLNNPFPPKLIHEMCSCQGNWLLRAWPLREPGCACIADIDGDCDVGLDDFDALMAAWGPCPDRPQPCPADLDGDGIVGIIDFLILLANWG